MVWPISGRSPTRSLTKRPARNRQSPRLCVAPWARLNCAGAERPETWCSTLYESGCEAVNGSHAVVNFASGNRKRNCGSERGRWRRTPAQGRITTASSITASEDRHERFGTVRVSYSVALRGRDTHCYRGEGFAKINLLATMGQCRPSPPPSPGPIRW